MTGLTFNRDSLIEAISKKAVKNPSSKNVEEIKSLIGDVKKPSTKDSSVIDTTKWGTVKPVGVKLESIIKKTSAANIATRALYEAENAAVSKSGAFRLISGIVADRGHAKFAFSRRGVPVKVEIMYPNANGMISLKVMVDGSEDKTTEIRLDDERYINNFGSFIISVVDEILDEAGMRSNIGSGYDPYTDIAGQIDDSTQKDATPVSAAGNSGAMPIWVMESKFSKAFALVEAEQGKDEEETPTPSTVNAETPPIGADELGFDLSTMGTDTTAPVDSGAIGGIPAGAGDMGDLGGLAGLGGNDPLSTGMPAGMPGTGAVEPSAPVADAPTVDVSNVSSWSQDAVRGMAKLLARAAYNSAKRGNAPIPSERDLLNGSTGYVTEDSNKLRDQFLDVYSELKGAQMDENLFNKFETALADASINPDSFNAWLQENLDQIQGSVTMDDSIDEDLFKDQTQNFPKGGEKKQTAAPSGSGDFDSFLSSLDNFGAGEKTSDVPGITPEELGASADIFGLKKEAKKVEKEPLPNLQ